MMMMMNMTCDDDDDDESIDNDGGDDDRVDNDHITNPNRGHPSLSVRKNLNLLAQVWKRHTQFMNHTGDIVREVRRRIHPELCTKAWCKMFEMLHTFELLPTVAFAQRRPVRTLHVCEAPGAFICATNHFLRVQQSDVPVDWDWLALSLNPYYEGNDLGAMIDDDRFLSETEDHWYFGADDSGNIMHRENVTSLWARLRERFQGEVDMVTGDGSVDCSSDPNDQESIVAGLHMCEAICALGVLRKGGSFVLKMFTLFEHQSWSLVYLLCCAFTTVDIHKPATSTQGNAEVYIICQVRVTVVTTTRQR
jgi:cap2 methyltransferase